MMGTSGIVGPCILHATGGGYTFKIQKKDNVSVACFGDGAVNNRAFHEGLNMASIWNLPYIFVCENNQFATEVPFEYSSGIPDVGRRAADYGIPGNYSPDTGGPTTEPTSKTSFFGRQRPAEKILTNHITRPILTWLQ